MGSLLRFVTQGLQAASRYFGKQGGDHLATGNRGETEAYLYLREHGYRVVATNFRAAGHRGEIDLIAWDNDVLCFVEVKTRTGVGLAPPEAAVDGAKKAHVRAVARRYIRRLPGERVPPCRFDIVSVTYLADGAKPEVRLIKRAFGWRSRRRFEPYQDRR